MDLVLRALLQKDEHVQGLTSTVGLIGDEGHQKMSLLITETLDEMERILTEAPEGRDFSCYQS